MKYKREIADENEAVQIGSKTDIYMMESGQNKKAIHTVFLTLT